MNCPLKPVAVAISPAVLSGWFVSHARMRSVSWLIRLAVR